MIKELPHEHCSVNASIHTRYYILSHETQLLNTLFHLPNLKIYVFQVNIKSFDNLEEVERQGNENLGFSNSSEIIHPKSKFIKSWILKSRKKYFQSI